VPHYQALSALVVQAPAICVQIEWAAALTIKAAIDSVYMIQLAALTAARGTQEIPPLSKAGARMNDPHGDAGNGDSVLVFCRYVRHPQGFNDSSLIQNKNS